MNFSKLQLKIITHPRSFTSQIVRVQRERKYPTTCRMGRETRRDERDEWRGGQRDQNIQRKIVDWSVTLIHSDAVERKKILWDAPVKPKKSCSM
jgi:hypothetical protein